MNDDNIWDELYKLINSADIIADNYSNLLINDAGGSTDCSKIHTHLQKCLEILKYYHNVNGD